MSGRIRAFAPAKVNLSLTVHGKRADGYHALTSLVVFADVGDTLTLVPSDDFELRTDGPTGARIDGPNLIETAAEHLAAIAPEIPRGNVSLTKVLPVGAGVGGGSSDVAAYLRAVRQTNHAATSTVDWSELALKMGADVPVCLAARGTWMCGIGEILLPLAHALPTLHAVLVNPGIAVPTGPVFQKLAAPPIRETAEEFIVPELSGAVCELASLANDLEAPALTLVPEIRHVRAALEASDGVQVVRMSGSGATYFGLYDTQDHARAAAEQISISHPDWWVAPTSLRDIPSDRLVMPA